MRLPCLRGSDPILDEIRYVFGANPLRVPDSRVTPGKVLTAVAPGPLRYRGELEPLVGGDTPFVLPPWLVQESQLAHLSGRRTNSMDLKVGFELLEGWAAGLGLTGAMPSVKAQYATAREVWFAFADVKRRFVDVGVLARLLGNRKLVVNAATQPFLDANDPATMLLVDSVLVSHSFSFGGTSSGTAGLDVDIGAIQEALGRVSVGTKVERSTADTVAFTGPLPLAFAFTVKEVGVTPDGRIASFNESREGVFMASDGAALPEPNWVAKLSPVWAGSPDAVAEIDFGGA